MEIYKALLKQPGVTKAALERPLGTNRPDVSAYINGVPVAIEVQISSLSMETIAYRTTEYFRKGVYVLWLLQWTPELDNPRYSPSKWEKWIHAAYFGNVYYWTKGLTVVNYRFDVYKKHVPKVSWLKNGRKVTKGSYNRRSIRYRNPMRGKTFNLATDFGPKEREWWKGDGFAVPSAKIFTHLYVN